MKRVKRLSALLIALLLLLTTVAAFAVFAEESTSSEESSSSVAEVDSSSSSEKEESSSSEEESSSSEEESSSSSEEESSSSSEEESSSSSGEESSSSNKKPSSSDEELSFIQTIVDKATGITVGLSQPNEDLDIEAALITSDNEEYKEVYAKLSAQSKEQEAIWDMIKYLLSEDYQRKMRFTLPVNRAAMEKKIDIDEHNVTFAAFGEVFIGELESWESEIFRDYIEGIRTCYYYDYKVHDILMEEAEKMLAGDQSPQECADMMQSRVSIYLREQS